MLITLDLELMSLGLFVYNSGTDKEEERRAPRKKLGYFSQEEGRERTHEKVIIIVG